MGVCWRCKTNEATTTVERDGKVYSVCEYCKQVIEALKKYFVR